MSDVTVQVFDTKTQTIYPVKYHDNGDGSYTEIFSLSGGTVQFGHIAVVANGLNADATEGDLPGSDQRVQLPNIPCRKVVIAYPSSAIVGAAAITEFAANGCANSTGRFLFYGDAAGQHWALDMGEVEELEVSNANQIWLRDVSFDWEDFNNDGPHSTSYVLCAYWRVIK